MKKTLTIFLLSILVLSLFLCGCDLNSQKEQKSPFIQKTEIRQDDNGVTVVYEDGYELTYSFTQPIYTIIEKDGMRSARAIGSIYAHYNVSINNATIAPGSTTGSIEYSTSIDNSGNFVVSGNTFIGNVNGSDLQIQMGTVDRCFEKDGKQYEDCSYELLTIFRANTTLIDFATGYENEPYDNIFAFGFAKFEKLESIILPTSIKKVDKKAFDECNKLTTVYYYGTAAEWQSVELVSTEIKTIDKDKNETVEITENALAKCTVYFYSEEAPTDAGNYWHLVDGKPVAW